MPDNKKMRPMIKHFLQGLAVLLPIGLTFYLIFVLFRFIYEKLSFIREFIISHFSDLNNFNFFIEVGLTILVLVIIFFTIMLFGIVAKTVLGKGIGKFTEWIIEKLPGVNSLYKGIKQVLKMFFSQNQEDKFSKSLLVEYPRRGCWSIAFLTSESSPNMSPDNSEDYYNVFMPTTPNPTNGFLLIVPKDQVIVLDVPIDTAFKVLISGGLLAEENKEETDFAEEIKMKIEKRKNDRGLNNNND